MKSENIANRVRRLRLNSGLLFVSSNDHKLISNHGQLKNLAGNLLKLGETIMLTIKIYSLASRYIWRYIFTKNSESENSSRLNGFCVPLE